MRGNVAAFRLRKRHKRRRTLTIEFVGVVSGALACRSRTRRSRPQTRRLKVRSPASINESNAMPVVLSTLTYSCSLSSGKWRMKLSASNSHPSRPSATPQPFPFSSRPLSADRAQSIPAVSPHVLATHVGAALVMMRARRPLSELISTRITKTRAPTGLVGS